MDESCSFKYYTVCTCMDFYGHETPSYSVVRPLERRKGDLENVSAHSGKNR